MVAVRPNFHQPALFAKAAANIDRIARRPAGAQRRLLLVGGRGDPIWPAVRPARRPLCPHQPNGCSVVDGLWREERFSFEGQRYQLDERDLRAQAGLEAAADHLCRRRERGGQDDDRQPVRRLCHARRSGRGDHAEDRRHGAAARRGRQGPPMQFGMAAYAIVRDSEAEAKARAGADHRAPAQAARASPISTNGCRARSSSAS